VALAPALASALDNAPVDEYGSALVPVVAVEIARTACDSAVDDTIEAVTAELIAAVELPHSIMQYQFDKNQH